MKKLLLSLGVITLAACTKGSFSAEAPNFAWHVDGQTIVYDEFAPPITSLVLVDENTGTTHFKTECDGTASTGVTIDDLAIVSNVRCWWAGGGEDFAVFEGEQDQFTVQTRWIDEESGEGEWEMAK